MDPCRNDLFFQMSDLLSQFVMKKLWSSDFKQNIFYAKQTLCALKPTVTQNTKIMDDLYFTSNPTQGLLIPAVRCPLPWVTHRLGCTLWWGALLHLLLSPATPSALASPLVRETWRVSSLFLLPGAVAGVSRDREEATDRAGDPQHQAQIFSPVKRH